MQFSNFLLLISYSFIPNTKNKKSRDVLEDELMSKKLIALAFCTMMTFSTVFAEFDPCKFNFGTDWDFLNTQQSSDVATNVDYVTIWLNDPSFNQYWHGKMVSFCKDKGKTPVFYSYIIAKASALGDADVGGKLAKEGANFIRNSWSTVTQRYENYASSIAGSFGTEKTCIWLMEPDYFQYSAGSQNGGGISYSQLSSKMNELIAIVKKHLPNAQFSLDISPWNNDQANYIKSFDMSKFSYMNTSGGRTEAANTRIRTDNNNNVTWAGVSEASGKGIIADDGYGTGGSCTGHDASWDDVNNLKSRIKDGVIGITQKCCSSGWGNTVANVEKQLEGQTVKSCGTAGNKFTLTITTPTGGTIVKDPNAESYAAGTKVKLTATPSEGYVFKNWSGAASGTNSSVEITMDASKTVTAVFEQKPANVALLTIKVTGGMGTVTKNPDKAMYDKGSTVTLTAKPSSGTSMFEGWSGGGLSGNELTTTITLNSDVTVTATFKDTVKIDTLHIEAESFTEKSGDKIVTETTNGTTSIGYIENGYSTTYKVTVSRAGKYALSFRVGTGLDRAEFTVAVDGKTAGTISFTGTKDNWTSFHIETLDKIVDLTTGEHSVKLIYGAALNVDKFMLVMNAPEPSAVHKRVINTVQQNLHAIATNGGFIAQLPNGHAYSSYSLFDFRGRLASSGKISMAMSQLTFSNLSRDVWILRLEGSEGCSSLRTAVVR
jgi:uncharacterized repeat protein (TIGR02543 family)